MAGLEIDRETAAPSAAGPAPAVPATAPTAFAPGALTVDSVVALQRSAGNVGVTRLVGADAHPSAPRPPAPPMPPEDRLLQRALARPGDRCPCGGTIDPDGECDRCRAAAGARGGILARDPLPESPMDLSAVPDFASYTEAERMSAVRRILAQRWVGPVDEGTLERIWRSFGDEVVAVASRNLELFRQSADRGAELLNLPQLQDAARPLPA